VDVIIFYFIFEVLVEDNEEVEKDGEERENNGIDNPDVIEKGNIAININKIIKCTKNNVKRTY